MTIRIWYRDTRHSKMQAFSLNCKIHSCLQYWEDRLLRAKSLGLNVIQTYVPWNLHEPQPEEWSFDGIADLELFLKLAHKLGFLVMLRAGPYVCAGSELPLLDAFLYG
eukprot:Gb_08734 [translate_table: standard]